MIYPLPDEEDIEAIRRELARLIEERDAQAIRERLLTRYVRGEIELRDIAADRIAFAVQEHVRRIVQRATERDWKTIRREVFDRDKGMCHVCGDSILWGEYECGHIIDRVCGGCDRPSNLVTMCILCNRLKPLHSTRAEYIAWDESGAWFQDVVEALT